VFTCCATPYRIAFFDEDELDWIIIDSVVDFFFLIDIIFTFFTAYYGADYRLIDIRRDIAKWYLSTWFLIDVCAIIPISIILNSGNFNGLARLARLPKLYRLVKMTRLVRILKIVKERNKFAKYLTEILKIGVGFERLLFFILIFIVMCHIVCCFWYVTCTLTKNRIFIARWSDFDPDTWVA
jgi:hypothetical protein